MKFMISAALAATMAFAPVLACADTKVPEGTEFPIRIEDALSSKTATEGDRFTISLTEDVKLPDGTVLKAGYRGVGEVAVAEKNGMMGKSGKLSLRVNYLKVGDERIKLRATKASEGKGNTGNQVVGVIFLGVFAAFKGHSVEIPKGTKITAFADQDTDLVTPVAPPPSSDI
jgi:hypothetical protein